MHALGPGQGEEQLVTALIEITGLGRVEVEGNGEDPFVAQLLKRPSRTLDVFAVHLRAFHEIVDLVHR